MENWVWKYDFGTFWQTNKFLWVCWVLTKKFAFKDPPSLKFHDLVLLLITRLFNGRAIGKLEWCPLNLFRKGGAFENEWMWKRLDLNSDKNPFKKAKRCKEKSFETSHWLPNAGRHPLKAMHARTYWVEGIFDDIFFSNGYSITV